ncbi:hypothetical protein ACOMHN_042272 [Nucella lapillus]
MDSPPPPPPAGRSRGRSRRRQSLLSEEEQGGSPLHLRGGCYEGLAEAARPRPYPAGPPNAKHRLVRGADAPRKNLQMAFDIAAINENSEAAISVLSPYRFRREAAASPPTPASTPQKAATDPPTPHNSSPNSSQRRPRRNGEEDCRRVLSFREKKP